MAEGGVFWLAVEIELMAGGGGRPGMDLIGGGRKGRGFTLEGLERNMDDETGEFINGDFNIKDNVSDNLLNAGQTPEDNCVASNHKPATAEESELTRKRLQHSLYLCALYNV